MTSGLPSLLKSATDDRIAAAEARRRCRARRNRRGRRLALVRAQAAATRLERRSGRPGQAAGQRAVVRDVMRGSSLVMLTSARPCPHYAALFQCRLSPRHQRRRPCRDDGAAAQGVRGAGVHRRRDLHRQRQRDLHGAHRRHGGAGEEDRGAAAQRRSATRWRHSCALRRGRGGRRATRPFPRRRATADATIYVGFVERPLDAADGARGDDLQDRRRRLPRQGARGLLAAQDDGRPSRRSST